MNINMLGELPDNDLVENIKAENHLNESLQILMTRHMGICTKTALRYANVIPSCSGISVQDLLNDRALIVYKAAQDYMPERAKFSTHLANRMRFHCLDTLQDSGRYCSYEDKTLTYLVDSKQQIKPDLDYVFDSEQALYAFSVLESLSDKRIKKIFKLRYFGNHKKSMPWADIAKKMKLSPQGVIDLHNKGLDFLKVKFAKE